jgi:hypothetical protein
LLSSEDNMLASLGFTRGCFLGPHCKNHLLIQV